MPRDARRNLKISRDGSGVYSKAVGTTAAANEVIASAQFNSTIDDLVTDANTARPIVAGGTGATTAAAARTALGPLAVAQTSVTDNTAGSGLIVGGFGIGAEGVTASGSLDNAIYTGVYAVQDATEDTPDTTGPTGCSCIVTRFNSSTIQQVFIRRGSTANDVRLFVRQMRNSVWGEWAGIQAVEGSTANGYYIKHPTGWLQCFSSALTFTRASSTTASVTWTFPFACVASPLPHFRVDSLSSAGGDYTGDITIGDVGQFAYNKSSNYTTSASLTLFRSGSTTWSSGTIANVHVSMSGRWF